VGDWKERLVAWAELEVKPLLISWAACAENFARCCADGPGTEV
jgi:hypothetical protein